MMNLIDISKKLATEQSTVEFLHEKHLLMRNYLCCDEYCSNVGDDSQADFPM